MTTSRIFVGYDGTPASVAAVGWAADAARLRHSPLRIVTCCDIPVSGDIAYGPAPPENLEASFHSARAAARRMQEAIELETPEVDVAVEVTFGSPAMELLAEAGTRAMIVIGASRHHGAQAILFGRTGRQLARHQTCPLVVVRETAHSTPPTRVVVGIGGSTGAASALRWAADEAQRRRVDLRLLHVWDRHDGSREKATTMLDDSAAAVRNKPDVNVRTELVERSSDLSFAELVSPEELLVIGSHTRGRLKTALFGSTVNNLIERSPATVVIVPGQPE